MPSTSNSESDDRDGSASRSAVMQAVRHSGVHATGLVREWGSVLVEAGHKWWNDDAPRMGAALAYYTLFSLAPLLVVAVAVAGAFFGEAAARGQLIGYLTEIVGPAGAELIQSAIASAGQPRAGVLATVGSLALSLFAASGVLNELRRGIDIAWASEPVPRASFREGVIAYLRARAWTFFIVLGVGLVLMASLVGSAFLHSWTLDPTGIGRRYYWVSNLLDVVVSISVVALLFGVLYKLLPATRVAWRDVWPGAFVGSTLFWIGHWAIGLYLRNSTVASIYGAAGSLVVIMVFAWFSALVLLFGVEICQVVAKRRGRVVSVRGRRPALATAAHATTGKHLLEEDDPHPADSHPTGPLSEKLDTKPMRLDDGWA